MPQCRTLAELEVFLPRSGGVHAAALQAGQTILQDGKWHMATISTLPGGVKGYSLYIDGFQAGVLNGNNTYLGGSTLS